MKELADYKYLETKNGILYCGDCLEILPLIPDNSIDLTLTEPPFGVGNFVQVGGNVRGEKVLWNESTPPQVFFDMVKTKSKNQIIWGANYFNCFSSNGGAIIWVKNQPMPNFSKAEIASCTFHKKIEMVTITWTNFVNDKTTKHPCERPVSLYTWCLEKYTKPSDVIMDCYSGSGSILVACEKMDRKYIGIEINKEYCEWAKKRIEKEANQGKLF